ncbi:MAG: type II secretion system protein [Kiritimatiellae bacterium]|nr:type II secretion system protein [Kiritimatiellia bacterium]
MHRHPESRERAAFTLIELLAVIAIIMVLAALLFPALQGVQGQAKSSQCKSNLRQLAAAAIAYAADNEGMLPGVDDKNIGGNYWIGTEAFLPGWSPSRWSRWNPTTYGVLMAYLGVTSNDAQRIYRCPALPARPVGSGLGSNGMFDYTMIKKFGCASLGSIPQASLIYSNFPWMGVRSIRTPLFVEEDFLYYCNTSIDVNWIDTGHANADRLGNWHGGRGNFAAVDGSVQTLHVKDFNEGGRFPPLFCWGFVVPSGRHRTYMNPDFMEVREWYDLLGATP